MKSSCVALFPRRFHIAVYLLNNNIFKAPDRLASFSFLSVLFCNIRHMARISSDLGDESDGVAFQPER